MLKRNPCSSVYETVPTQYVFDSGLAQLQAVDRDGWLVALWSPPAVREALAALFLLDRELAGLPLRLRDPMAAELRLVWWRGQLEALDHAPPPPRSRCSRCLPRCWCPGWAARRSPRLRTGP